MAKEPYRLIRFRTREDWLAYRRNVITATNAPSILGNSPWESAFDVYLKLVKGKERKLKENEAMAKGNAYEPLVRQAFGLRYKDTYKVINPPKSNWIIQSREKPYLCATPDGLLRSLSDGKIHAGLECKYHEIRGRKDEEKWVNGELPQNYYSQVLETMIVGSFSTYYLASWLDYFDFDGEKRKFNRSELRIYEFYADEMKEDIDYEEKKLTEFWNENVLKRVPPEATYLFQD